MSLILDIHGPLMSCGQLRREALLYKNAFFHLDWLGELDPTCSKDAMYCSEAAHHPLHQRQYVLGFVLRAGPLLQIPRTPSF